MTRDEAALLLNVKSNAQQGEVDNSFTSLCLHYVRQQNLSTDPSKCDAASQALGLIQEAYATLTGQSAPKVMPVPNLSSQVASDEIPRVSLNGRKVAPTRGATVKASSPAGKSRWEWRIQFRWGWPELSFLRTSDRESAVALAICAGIILIVILMLILFV